MRIIIDNEKKHRKLVQKKVEEQTRELYSNQNEKLIIQVKMDYKNRLAELVKRYEELAENVVKQVERLQTDSVKQLREDESLKNHDAVEQTESRAIMQQDIIAAKQQNADWKSPDLQRLTELKLIGGMIKEIARQQREEAAKQPSQ